MAQSSASAKWIDFNCSDPSVPVFGASILAIYAPIAVLLIEPSEMRRRIMLLCLAAGAGVAAYLLYSDSCPTTWRADSGWPHRLCD